MFVKILFIVSAALTIGSSVLVATVKNIMHACVFLLGALVGVCGLYVTLGADFVAATQLMVYVGGVVILMLFAVMLTGGREFMANVKVAFNRAPYMGSTKTYVFGILTAIVFFLSMFKIFQGVINFQPTGNYAMESTLEKIGVSLITDHVLAFELSSVLLLGALIGAAIIARPERR